MIKSIIVTFLLLIVCACSVVNTNDIKPQVDVTVDEPNRLRFTGKGAGAGMMLMSSMGPTGIAIGIAIDEGIGKTIANTADQYHINFAQRIQKRFLAKLVDYNQHSKLPIKTAKLNIKRYGFITKGGEDDLTISEYVIRYQLNNNTEWQEFRFPEQINEQEVLLKQPLEKVKTDGEAISNLITDGLTYLDIKYG